MKLLLGLLLLSLLFVPLYAEGQLKKPPSVSSKPPSTPSNPPPSPNIPAGGDWKPIDNVADGHVKEVAEYAVTEYNKKNGGKLKLGKVIKGETQETAGKNYRMVVEVKNEASSATEKYETFVWDNPNFKDLKSFIRVP